MASGTAEDQSPRTERSPSLRGAVLVALVHVVLVGLCVFTIVKWELDPHPKADGDQCELVLEGDGLLDLAGRPTSDAARDQLARWSACDDDVDERALDALEHDRKLIALIAVGFAMAVVQMVRVRRWKLAGILLGLLALTWFVADITENVLLRDLLKEGEWDWRLPWASAIKLGAVIGAMPLFLVSFAHSLGRAIALADTDAAEVIATQEAHSAVEDHKDAPGVSSRLQALVSRSFERLVRVEPPAPAAVDVTGDAPPDAGLGISCSGGGVRSAAFNLGALQALEEPSTTDPKGELGRAKWLSAVSGGSYIAAAWVTARAHFGDAWSRLSAEEDHLRRHSSYMAPGFAGKSWALARFLFGFLVNLGLIVLFVGVVSLLGGWLVDAAQDDRPAASGGVLELPAGGCVQLADGSSVTLAPGAKLRAGDGGLKLDPIARATPPPKAENDSASATITEGDTVLEASVQGAGRADASGALPDGRRADVSAEVGDQGATTTTTSAPTKPSRCPATAEPTPAGSRTVVRAAAVGRRLEEGTKVKLALDAPIPVTSAGVEGCPGADKCVVGDADIVAVRPGSRLTDAPSVFVTLAGDAVVGADAVISKPCGATACQRYASPGWLDNALAGLIGLTLLVGISHVVAKSTQATAKRTIWGARILCGVSAVGVTVFFAFPYVVSWAENGRWWLQDRELQAGGAGTLVILAALAAQVAPFVSAGDAPASKAVGAVKKLGARLRPLLIRLAGAVVGPLVVLSIAVAFASYAAQESAGELRPGLVGLWLALLGPLVLLLAGGDLNQWSLHPYYRDRLRSAYAVDPEHQPPNDPREDPLPDLPAAGPQLLVCAAVNLADDRVTAPGRSVASWTFSKESLGSRVLGRVPPDGSTVSTGFMDPAHLPSELDHLAWTWTAVAVSGAAFSPAMGKMNRPERFLLALGNLRLGVWYPNPTWHAVEPYWYERHHPRPWYLAKEALGRLRADDRWLYVTDGGHYENLGLIELLRKGCREIYCFDAAGDRPDTFGTLSDAMRLARAEEGIEVSFSPGPLKPDEDGVSKVGVQAGTVTWTRGTAASAGTPVTGWIVLAKLSVPKTAPFDIVDLARTLPSFPNHPTADQLFTDQKFEAYRALGFHLGQKAGDLGRRIRELIDAGTPVGEAVAAANGEVNGPASDSRDHVVVHFD